MFKNTLKKVPGFRSGHKWKMALAVIFYLFMIIIILNPSGITLRDKIVWIIQYLILLGIPFVLITNMGNIRNKIHVFNKKTVKSTVISVFITIIIMGIGFSMIDTLKSPEQKQSDLIAAQQADANAEAKAKAKKNALALDEKILALGEVNTLTYDSADDVMSLRKEYEALSTEEKELIEKLELLESAEKKMTNIMVEVASALDDKILAFGDIDSLIYDNANAVMSIRKEYETLPSAQKELLKNLTILESAEKKIAELKMEVVSEIDNKIESLGDANSLTFDKADLVLLLRKEYEGLSAEEKGLVRNLALLESAEKKIIDLKTIADKAAEEKAAAEKAAAEKKAAEEKAAADKKAAETKAVEDYENWILNQFSAWDGSNRYLVKLVKENLNDPKSFEHVETVYWDKGNYILVKMTYRANNAFGALILQNITAKADYVSQTISVISQND